MIGWHLIGWAGPPQTFWQPSYERLVRSARGVRATRIRKSRLLSPPFGRKRLGNSESTSAVIHSRRQFAITAKQTKELASKPAGDRQSRASESGLGQEFGKMS